MTEPLDYAQVNPVALDAPIAPHIAAERQGKRLQASRLAGICRGVMMGSAEFVLIEGAGGWRVPISPRETLADLAVQLQVGVILVVGMRLGCINHALLTAEAVRRDGLVLAGWVANQPGETMICHKENLNTLQRMIPAPLLGEVPQLTPFDPVEAGKLLSLHHILGN
jgi:dethiobiotin synthetase